MKNVLLSLSIAFMLLNGASASAQQILTQNGKDTATASGSGTSIEVDNHIKSATATPVKLRWNVTNYHFDTGWDITNSSVCDNQQCPGYMSVIVNGDSYYSQPYDNTTFNGTLHDFHALFGLNSPAVGSSSWMKISLYDTVSKTGRLLTFIATKSAAAGVTTINSSDDVTLYPNPAREAVNVLYDEKAGVKTIAIFNMIGKLMGPIYKPSSNGGAKIDVDDMPTGIYFLRLMDGQGHTIATRRFTRQ